MLRAAHGQLFRLASHTVEGKIGTAAVAQTIRENQFNRPMIRFT